MLLYKEANKFDVKETYCSENGLMAKTGCNFVLCDADRLMCSSIFNRERGRGGGSLMVAHCPQNVEYNYYLPGHGTSIQSVSEKKNWCVIFTFLEFLLLIYPVLDRRMFCLRLMTNVLRNDIP